MIKLIKTLFDLFLLVVLAVIGVIIWFSYTTYQESEAPSAELLSNDQEQVQGNETEVSENDRTIPEQPQTRSGDQERETDKESDKGTHKAEDKEEKQQTSTNKLTRQELLSKENLTSTQKLRKLKLLTKDARERQNTLPGPDSIKQMPQEKIRKYTPEAIAASKSVLEALRLADQLGRDDMENELRDVRDRIESVKLLLQKRLFKEFNQNSSGG